MKEHAQSPRVHGRSLDSEMPVDVLDRVQLGTMRTTYRGVPFNKVPFDISRYLQLLGGLAPRTVIEIDGMRLGEVLPRGLLEELRHPLLVSEDSSHMYAESTAVLEFFHPVLEPGDYLVVEDGVVAQLSDDHYRRYENGPNRAVADFLAAHGSDYQIDADLCDRFGHNATYNPNGWLRRV